MTFHQEANTNINLVLPEVAMSPPEGKNHGDLIQRIKIKAENRFDNLSISLLLGYAGILADFFDLKTGIQFSRGIVSD